MQAETRERWKRKNWYEILAPQSYNSAVLGHSFAEAPEGLKGRMLSVNLMQLTGNIKKQNIVLRFKIIDAKESKGVTTITTFALQNASLRRLVRKGLTKLSDSFICKTKDDLPVRIKPLLLTRSKANSGVRRELRRKCRELLIKSVSELPFEQLVLDLVDFKVQKEIKTVLDKIFPLRHFQVSYAGIDTSRAPSIVTLDQVERVEEETEEETEE